MGYRLVLVLVAGLGLAAPQPGPEPQTPLGREVVVRSLAPGVWGVMAFRPGSPAVGDAASSLLVTTGETSILIDTGWTASQTGQLLDWAEKTLKRPVRHVIVTSAELERRDSLLAFAKRTIVLHGHAAAAEALRSVRAEPPPDLFEFEKRLDLEGEVVVLFDATPGAGSHGVVVWLPRTRILFGGKLVLSGDARDLGVAPAIDVKGWRTGVRRVIERFRDAAIVVPADGRPGGPELLSHTMELLETRAPHDGRPANGATP